MLDLLSVATSFASASRIKSMPSSGAPRQARVQPRKTRDRAEHDPFLRRKIEQPSNIASTAAQSPHM
jgi:hypothetical protein